jgi:hypothetical protein
MKMRKQKTERKKLVKQLDDVFSKYIRVRDKRSVLSGKTENLQCGHVFSRISYSTRWDPDNAFAITSGENLTQEYDPYPMYSWFIREYGKNKFDLLHAKWSMTTKFTNNDIKIMIQDFKNKLISEINL